MTPAALLETAVLLGLFAAAGGGYGGLYSLGRLWARPRMVRAGGVCWAIAFVIATVIAVDTPLDPGWKWLVMASAMVYAFIPPLTWRYLERQHHAEEPAP